MPKPIESNEGVTAQYPNTDKQYADHEYWCWYYSTIGYDQQNNTQHQQQYLKAQQYIKEQHQQYMQEQQHTQQATQQIQVTQQAKQQQETQTAPTEQQVWIEYVIFIQKRRIFYNVFLFFFQEKSLDDINADSSRLDRILKHVETNNPSKSSIAPPGTASSNISSGNTSCSKDPYRT